MNKQAELVARAEELGFKVEITKNGHYKVHTPNGPVFMPTTPGDSRHGWRKDRARLRRHGVAI